jgi:hypothetical protein
MNGDPDSTAKDAKDAKDVKNAKIKQSWSWKGSASQEEAAKS